MICWEFFDISFKHLYNIWAIIGLFIITILSKYYGGKERRSATGNNQTQNPIELAEAQSEAARKRSWSHWKLSAEYAQNIGLIGETSNPI